MSTQSPLDAVADVKAKIESIVLKSVLEAYATGLQQAAILVGDIAQAVAEDQMPPVGSTSETWKPERWSPNEAHQVSRVLSDLNDKLMARIMAVRVTIEGGGD